MNINNIRDFLNSPKNAVIFLVVCLLAIGLMFFVSFKGSVINDVAVNKINQNIKVKNINKNSLVSDGIAVIRNPFQRKMLNKFMLNDSNLPKENDDLDDIDISFIFKDKSRSYILIDDIKYKIGDRYKKYKIYKIKIGGVEFIGRNNKTIFIGIY